MASRNLYFIFKNLPLLRSNMIKTIAILLSVVLLIGIVPAFGDYIRYWGWGEPFDEVEPTICIFEPHEEQEQFRNFNMANVTRASIDDWVGKIENMSGTRNWDFDVVYRESWEYRGHPYWQFDCDVTITFESYFYSMETKKSKAGTTGIFLTGDRVWRDITVYMNQVLGSDLFGDDGEVNTTFRSSLEIEYIVSHELGHAFGLDHLVVECFTVCLTMNNYDSDKAKISIMYKRISHDIERDGVTDRDVKAIIQYYSEDGWGEHNRYGLQMYWWNTNI